MNRLLSSLCALVALALLWDAPLGAQSAAQPANEIPQRVLLTAGRSTVLTTDFDITRLAVTNPAVADAVVVKPREVLVDGKGAGTVSLIVWGANERKHYDIVVDPGVTNLQQNFQQLFPGEDINVAVTDDAVILSGAVSSNEVMLRSAELAKAAMPKHAVINMLQLPSGSPSKQVMLQVRFAEVNRNALQQSGLSIFSTRDKMMGRTTTQQFTAPEFDRQGDIDLLQFSDYLNIFLFSRTQGVGGILKALQSRGFLQSLAEPNLIAYNGEEASFLAGGEIPIPIVTGLGQTSVLFKEFGIRLTFRPTIAGDVIRLKLKPEVSTLDFTNGIVLQGFRIPALNTRRAETDVELRDGEASFLAGGEIPIPIVTGLGQTSVLFKEFGIRLTFRPTIAGDVIRLKLKPEVSTLDFTNGIVLQGFRIPALNTRRAETDVELRDGQSFAIAGLLNNLTQTDRQAIPLLSRLPIIGHLFKSRALRADQTELMVLVTPRLVRALDPDEVPAMPVRPGAFLNPSDDENKSLPGEEPDETTAPSLQDPPGNRRPVPPGTVKKPTRPPGGPQNR